MTNQKFETIRYFKASQLSEIEKSSEAAAVISTSNNEDNIAVLLTITNPAVAKKAVNITKDGFDKIRELIPVN